MAMLIESNNLKQEQSSGLYERRVSLTQYYLPNKLKRTNFSVKIESTSVFPKEFNSCRRRIMINSPNLLPRTSFKKIAIFILRTAF